VRSYVENYKPDSDGECKSGSHAWFGIAANIVAKAVIKSAEVDADGLVREELVHVGGNKFQ